MKKLLSVLLVLVIAMTFCFANGDKEEKTVVTFWTPYAEGDWSGDYLAKVIKEFNAANPDIEVQAQSMSDYATIIESLQRAVAANDLPSIATIGYGYDRYVLNSGKAVAYDNYVTKDFFGDFIGKGLESTTFDGKVYGVPFALSVPVVFYHADLFKQAGLDPDNPPKTWSEFMTAAQTLHDKLGVYGACFALDDPWAFECLLNSQGGFYYDDQAKKLGVNNATAKALLSDWAFGTKTGAFLYNSDFFETLMTFGANQAAMFVVSSYGTVTYRDSDPNIYSMPIPTGTLEDSIEAPIGGNAIYLFGNNEKERKAAAKFVEFLTSAEQNAEWAENSGYLPTRKTSLKAMDSFLDGFKNYEVAIAQIDNLVAPTQWPERHVLEINNILMNAIEAAMLGTKSASQALDEAAAKIQPLL